jgi:hypothetical protein
LAFADEVEMKETTSTMTRTLIKATFRRVFPDMFAPFLDINKDLNFPV